MPRFTNYSEALQWFQANNGRQVEGPFADGNSTFTLTVGDITSSVYRHPKLGVKEYCDAFKDACDEIRDRLVARSGSSSR